MLLHPHLNVLSSFVLWKSSSSSTSVVGFIESSFGTFHPHSPYRLLHDSISLHFLHVWKVVGKHSWPLWSLDLWSLLELGPQWHSRGTWLHSKSGQHLCSSPAPTSHSDGHATDCTKSQASDCHPAVQLRPHHQVLRLGRFPFLSRTFCICVVWLPLSHVPQNAIGTFLGHHMGSLFRLQTPCLHESPNLHKPVSKAICYIIQNICWSFNVVTPAIKASSLHLQGFHAVVQLGVHLIMITQLVFHEVDILLQFSNILPQSTHNDDQCQNCCRKETCKQCIVPIIALSCNLGCSHTRFMGCSHTLVWALLSHNLQWLKAHCQTQSQDRLCKPLDLARSQLFQPDGQTHLSPLDLQLPRTQVPSNASTT